MKIHEEDYMLEDSNRTYEVKFGEFSMYKDTIPEIEIIRKDVETGEEIKTYLSAFRWYKFQVSGTYDGELDLGSNPVFGLATFSSIISCGPSNLNTRNTKRFFIGAIAKDAVRDYCSRYCGFYKFDDSSTEFDKFVDAVMKECA